MKVGSHIEGAAAVNAGGRSFRIVATLVVAAIASLALVPSAALAAEDRETQLSRVTTAGKAVQERRVLPPAPVKAAVTTGGWYKATVSWYGPGFYGHGMAGGGTLQPGSMIVAHRSLPFGTRVQFGFRGKTCVAVVKDRGPFISGRLFDLGPGTAQAIGFTGVGVGVVQYRILR